MNEPTAHRVDATCTEHDHEAIVVREIRSGDCAEFSLNPFAAELLAESFARALARAVHPRWFTVLQVRVHESKGESPVYITLSRTSPKPILESAEQMRQAQMQPIEVERRLAKAVREADQQFQKVGGTTRHYVQDCLLPELSKAGVGIVLTDGAS